MSQYILEMKNICKSFPGTKVLDEMNIQVKAGEVHVILGENGAGKSTLIKILSGAYKKDTGEVFLEGVNLKNYTPKEAINKGISVIYQEFNLNPHVPIYENIYLGKEFSKNGILDKKKAIKESQKYMNAIGLDLSPTTLVSELSVAQMQMVEIAKAISADVKILVLDEPTAAITDKETERLFGIIRELKAKGVGIIYISHRMNELFEIGDRCTVLRDGRFIKTLNLKETNVDELIRLMVGRDVKFEKMENPSIVPDVTMLEVSNLCYRNLLKDISFDLKKGEILGISGLVGSGRTELAKCIIGVYRKWSGTIVIKNKKLRNKQITQSIKDGIVYLSEDRKDEGLVLSHSVAANIALPNLDKFGNLLLNEKKILQSVKVLMEKLRIKTSSSMQVVSRLSGGNQQKVVIAKWLLNDADVYIFDEPTRGIDVGARDEIYNIMYELLKKGSSIIMISSDLVEILKMSDRVAVMYEGQLAAILDNEQGLTQDRLLHYALGGNMHNELH